VRLLVLGAGYVGAKIAELALDEGHDVLLADNWHATRREQADALEARGARVETVDVREADAVRALLEAPFDRVHLLAAQASRPLSISDPAYTEQTNLVGPRVLAEALAEHGSRASVVFASSLHVYGPDLLGEVTAERPYGPQGDLAHLSKIYAELCLELYARRHGFDLALLRLGIVYGPSPVEHERPESQTVVDKFRRLVAAGEEPVLDVGGDATIGVVHVDDAARILLAAPAEKGISAANVAAETVTVRDVARLARGEPRGDEPAWTVASPFAYRHAVGDYLAGAA
jgi:nucleoside-diphosphate-sugar epimerase